MLNRLHYRLHYGIFTFWHSAIVSFFACYLLFELNAAFMPPITLITCLSGTGLIIRGAFLRILLKGSRSNLFRGAHVLPYPFYRGNFVSFAIYLNLMQNFSNVRSFAKTFRAEVLVRPQWADELAGHWLCFGVVREVCFFIHVLFGIRCLKVLV